MRGYVARYNIWHSGKTDHRDDNDLAEGWSDSVCHVEQQTYEAG